MTTTADLRLLVIDNNQSEICVLTEAFIEQSIPVAIQWLDGGHKAIAMFISASESQAPDIIMVDYRLTGSNGLEVIKVLSRNAKLQNTPMILISGMMDDELRSSCTESGATQAWKKPMDFQGYLALATSLKAMAEHVTNRPFATSLHG